MANSWKLYVNIKSIHVPCFFPSTQCVFSSAASWAFSKIKSSDSVRIDYLGWLDDMGACSQYQTNNTDNEYKRRFYGLVFFFLRFSIFFLLTLSRFVSFSIHFSMFFHQYLYFFSSFFKIFTRWSRVGAKFLHTDFWNFPFCFVYVTCWF